ncbi:MAG: C40 family peptidase [Clostridia bacterium]|nr:C40 family peptidase [Clostridia bacterium]
MKKKVLICVLCFCMAISGLFYAVADEKAVSYVTGDANGDGKVTPADASLILRYCVGRVSNLSLRNKINADVNRNGAVDKNDAAAILRHIVKTSPLTSTALDRTLYESLSKNTAFDSGNVEWITRVIQALPSSNKYRAVLYAGSKLMGKTYSEMDCSTFVKTAFRNAGYSFPSGASYKILDYYNQNGLTHALSFKSDGTINTSALKPGYILVSLNPSTGKANHVSLFVGVVNGQVVIMESGSSGLNGVRLTKMWYTSGYEWKYYINPLG